MSHINFESVSGRAVKAEYDLPAASTIVVVNQTSNIPLDNPKTPAANVATVTITVPESAAAGGYFLRAQDASGGFIAQSVTFSIS
jgi:hypothetical protein